MVDEIKYKFVTRLFIKTKNRLLMLSLKTKFLLLTLKLFNEKLTDFTILAK